MVSVLVVDDSALGRKFVIKALPKDLQADIRQAANGDEALKAYKDKKPDVIFLDLNMPVMDGYQLLEALKAQNEEPTVIVLSGDIQPKAAERVKALGAKAFIKKPYGEKEVAAILTELGIL